MKFCPYCGEIARLDVRELYIETREIVLDACCEWNLQGWIESIRDFSRRDRVRWMREMTGLIVHDILLDGDALRWTLHYGLEFSPIDFTQAKAFIKEHHRHCDPPPGWKYGISLVNGTELVGVMTAGRPGSRMLQEQVCIEITRVCVKDMTPGGLFAGSWFCSRRYLTRWEMAPPGQATELRQKHGAEGPLGEMERTHPSEADSSPFRVIRITAHCGSDIHQLGECSMSASA